MRRAISLCLLIIINFAIQTTLTGFHVVGNITPNLMLILTMSFGLMRGRKEGMLVGFFCGFLTDCYMTSLLGPFMFLYMLIGYLNGFFHKNYMIEDVLMPLLVIIVDEIVFNTCVFLVYFLLRNRLEFLAYFKGVIIPEALSTALLTIIIYKLYVSINKHLKKMSNKTKIHRLN